MEYEKIEELDSSYLNQFIEEVGNLYNPMQLVKMLMQQGKNMHKKLNVVAWKIFVAWAITIITTTALIVGNIPNISKELFLGFGAITGLLVILINMQFQFTEYHNPKSLFYKLFKKPQWLVRLLEKEEINNKEIAYYGEKLTNKRLQLELLEYFQQQNIHIEQHIGYQTQYLNLMNNLGKGDHLSAIKNVQDLLEMVKNNKVETTYYNQLKQALNIKSYIRKFL